MTTTNRPRPELAVRAPRTPSHAPINHTVSPRSGRPLRPASKPDGPGGPLKPPRPPTAVAAGDDDRADIESILDLIELCMTGIFVEELAAAPSGLARNKLAATLSRDSVSALVRLVRPQLAAAVDRALARAVAAIQAARA